MAVQIFFSSREVPQTFFIGREVKYGIVSKAFRTARRFQNFSVGAPGYQRLYSSAFGKRNRAGENAWRAAPVFPLAAHSRVLQSGLRSTRLFRRNARITATVRFREPAQRVRNRPRIPVHRADANSATLFPRHFPRMWVRFLRTPGAHQSLAGVPSLRIRMPGMFASSRYSASFPGFEDARNSKALAFSFDRFCARVTDHRFIGGC